MTDTQTIKDRVDLIQLISEYVQLKKAGVNWKGCCPFHQEKTPSFMVQPEKQFWHCFGCGKGGDAFSFIQEIEGLEFVEALKLLADRAGVKLDTFKSDIDKSQKNRILEINQRAANFFHRFLLEIPAARKALDYLRDRGMKIETIMEWQVGYIPDQWDLLIKYLFKKGCGIEDVVAAGLVVKKEQADPNTGRGYYDRFRGRIMFPIWNVHSDIIGFTGRVLVETEQSGGKYVNTPQTLVFDKSRLIFGLNKAKNEIRVKDQAIIVEGQMDVIACHQAGMKNVVAASGTALTLEHVKLIKRYTNNISIAFDADAAGLKAAKRGIDIAVQEGMNTKVIQLSAGAGKDADECIKKSVQTWFKAVEQAVDIMNWYFSVNIGQGLDLNDPKEKQRVAENILVEIAKIPYAIERDHWIQKLSNQLKVEVDALKTEMVRLHKQNQLSPPAVIKKPIVEQTTVNVPADRHGLDLENLFCLLIKQPDLYLKHKDEIKDDFFAFNWLSVVYGMFKMQYNEESKVNWAKIESAIVENDRQKFNRLLLQSEEFYSILSDKDLDRAFINTLDRVKERYKKIKMNALLNC